MGLGWRQCFSAARGPLTPRLSQNPADKRKNIPTAEYQSVLEKEQQDPKKVRYPRNGSFRHCLTNPRQCRGAPCRSVRRGHWGHAARQAAGARHGPRDIRNQSSLIRKINQATGVAPFGLVRVADLGDAWIERPFELQGALAEIAAFFATVHAAGVNAFVGRR